LVLSTVMSPPPPVAVIEPCSLTVPPLVLIRQWPSVPALSAEVSASAAVIALAQLAAFKKASAAIAMVEISVPVSAPAQVEG
jgi:hypothetical protein